MHNAQQQLQPIFKQLLRLRVVFFVVLLASMYGFIIWRSVALSSAEPDETAVKLESSSIEHPQIDQATITKIKQLKDSSVNVQALFDQARQNPFRE